MATDPQNPSLDPPDPVSAPLNEAGSDLASDPAPALPTSPERLLARLEALGLAAETFSHPPLHTVEEARAWRAAQQAAGGPAFDGGHCKNLFLKDKKKAFTLVVALEETPVRLQPLAKAIGAARVSFARPEHLLDMLGVTPGSVTPFALINDPEQAVRVVLDEALFSHETLYFHPLTNGMTTALSPAALLTFIRACGHAPERVDLRALAKAEDARG